MQKKLLMVNGARSNKNHLSENQCKCKYTLTITQEVALFLDDNHLLSAVQSNLTSKLPEKFASCRILFLLTA